MRRDSLGDITMGKKISSFILGLFFIASGINHFLSSELYVSIMPQYLPWHLSLVYVSGVAEIAGGVGAMIPRTRRMAGWGLIALLIAVFPANIQMLYDALRTSHSYQWLLWARLPLQIVLIGWVYWICIRRPEEEVK